MKIQFLLITFSSILFSTALFSQENLANQWILGAGGIDDVLELQGLSSMNFQSSSLTTQKIDSGFLNLNYSNSSICDEEGKLQFYSNGFSIANAEHQLMENGDSLTPDNLIAPLGMDHSQGVLILPYPAHPRKYVLLHSSMRIYGSQGVLFGAGGALYYTTIDMTKNNGLGKVSEKNIPAIIDTLAVGTLTACRHANGRDWWILIPEFKSNKMYRFLLTPEGVIQQPPQFMDEDLRSHPYGQAVFSPDGTKYARAIPFKDASGQVNMAELSIWNFDRCTGLLSDKISQVRYGALFANGVAISPNSRFLYHLSPDLILQYDLWAEDVFASLEIVANYDGYGEVIPGYGFFPARFLAAQLAPDDQIYISSTSSLKAMHVIHHPNEKGEDCNVEQHAFLLPTINHFSVPNHPNYRLGALEGSSCDTIVVASTVPTIPKVVVTPWPNPVSEVLNVSIAGLSPAAMEHLSFRINTVTGRKLSLQGRVYFDGTVFKIDMGGLTAGLYFCEGQIAGKILFSKKIIKI